MENSFRSIIDKSKSILILLPTRPFFDQAAAGLSLYLGLRDQKQVQISSPNPMTVEFNRLIGVNKITQDLGNRNMVIRFVDYKANDIERVSYDIENSQFRLTVIPKQSVNPPTKDQLDLSYSGVSADTVIVIGGANESHFPAISSKDLVGADLVHVGTRELSLSSNKSYVSFSRAASSVSEIAFALLADSKFPINEDIATNLLMGIEQGSDNFTGADVSSETFAIVSELMRMGGRRVSQAPDQRDYPPGSIPGTSPQRLLQEQGDFGRSSAQSAIPPQPQLPLQPQIQAQEPQGQMQQQAQKSASQDAPNQPEKKEDKDNDEVPKDWLEPRIYKGTSIS